MGYHANLEILVVIIVWFELFDTWGPDTALMSVVKHRRRSESSPT